MSDGYEDTPARGHVSWTGSLSDGTYLAGGSLDVTVWRDRNEAWGGRWRWWKRYLPRFARRWFGYREYDWSPFSGSFKRP